MIKIELVLKVVRINQHVKFQTIQSDCNKNSGDELTIFDASTSEKTQMKKKYQK